MIWLLAGVGGLVGLVIVMALVGACLPKGHRASRSARFHQTPDTLWAAITDVASYPTWRADLKQVETLPDREGRPSWRETGSQGPMTFEVVESRPPSRLVVRIADKNLPFGGSWTYEIAPAEGGCTLTITEDGEIYNVLFRFLARFVFGYMSTLDAVLRALGRRFGQGETPVGPA